MSKNKKTVYSLWIFGMSAAGKTTLARAFDILYAKKINGIRKNSVIFIDGDQFRKEYCSDLGFSDEDRILNIERAVAYVAGIHLNSNCLITVSTFMAPLKKQREIIKNINTVLNGNQRENIEIKPKLIFVDCPLEECINRDPKGLYRKKLKNLSGFTSNFEKPKKDEVDLILDCRDDIQKNCNLIVENILNEEGLSEWFR